MRDEDVYWLALYMVKGVGPLRFRKLLNAFGSPSNVFNQPFDALKDVIGNSVASNILENDWLSGAEKQLSTAQKLGADIVTLKDKEYPQLLAQIDSAPPVMFYRGDIGNIHSEAVGIVGTRSPTHYGQRVAIELSRSLAEAGFVVVSGGARGIDSYAHKGALEAGGVTVVVLGSGLDRIYPRENKKLFDKIVGANGVVLTEYPFGTSPAPENFPRRNRIISGLSKGVIVVEAGMTSGALITAKWSSSFGRDVFAVPGPITSPKSEGCNYLIRMGAKVVTSANDIIEEYGGVAPSKRQELRQQLEGVELKIYELLSEKGPLHVDELSELLELTSSQTITHLFVLEMKGVIHELPGKFFAIKS